MLYYKATAGCGVGVFVGVSVRKRTAPIFAILKRSVLAGWACQRATVQLAGRCGASSGGLAAQARSSVRMGSLRRGRIMSSAAGKSRREVIGSTGKMAYAAERWAGGGSLTRSCR